MNSALLKKYLYSPEMALYTSSQLRTDSVTRLLYRTKSSWDLWGHMATWAEVDVLTEMSSTWFGSFLLSI